MMEQALRYELIQAIPELTNQVYPTNAPEGSQGPYLVYARINTDKVKTLEGYTNKQALSYMFSIMAVKYSDMVKVRDKVEDMLLGLPGTEIGDKSTISIEDIDINNIDEQYEHELGVNRGIIDFTIYF
jgi:hypothetical protein